MDIYAWRGEFTSELNFMTGCSDFEGYGMKLKTPRFQFHFNRLQCFSLYHGHFTPGQVDPRTD